MKRLIILVFVTSILGSGFTQNKNSKLHIKAINFDELESLIHTKVNHLRDSLKLQPLVSDEILKKAALDHSDYQLRIKKLTHKQQKWDKKTPYSRVAYYEGTHSTVGENVAFSYVNKKTKLKNGITENNNTLESIAESLFQGWKHSPGHYANMICKDYYTSGINFALDVKTKRIYATHVFGGKPYVAPKGVFIKKNAYNIKEGIPKLCDKIKEFKYGSEFFANYLIRKDREIYIYFHDLKYFKKILSGVNDAIAIDIIERKQLPCNNPNVFHGNPVHDGVMLKPVYFYELYKNNEADQKNYLLSHLGTIPEGMNGELQFNTMLIKSNRMCYNSYSVTVPSSPIPMFPFYPLFDLTDTLVENDTLDLSLYFNIPFNRGKVDYSSRAFKTLYNRIKGYKKYIKNISVQTYSSIEGSSSKNKILQEQRLKSIITKIKSADLPNSVNVTGKSQENWDLFYKQIKGTDYDYLSKKTKKEVKAFLTNKSNLYQFEMNLFAQRTAKVSIDINGIINANNTKDLYDLSLSYHNKLENKQPIEANAVISKALKKFDVHSEFPYDIFYADSITRKKKNLSIYTNQLGMLLNVNWFTINKKESIDIKKFIHKNKSYLPLQYNYYCHAIKYMHLEEEVLLAPDKLLEGILALKKHKNWKLYEKQINEENFNRLIINYHLAALKYHRKKRKYDKVDESLEVIKKFFSKANMTVKESTKMGLFFNEYYHFDWTVEILRPYLKESKVDEEAIFTFVQTATLLRNEFSDEDYFTYMMKAKNTNKTRFCKWINKDFQLLRYEGLKKVYCESCK